MFSPIRPWVNSLLICIILSKVHFSNRNSKRWCLIYTCDTNWYEPTTGSARSGGKQRSWRSFKLYSFRMQSFFAIILFRSKAQLILRNWKKHVFAGFHSTTIVLIGDKHFSFFFLTKLNNKPPNLQIYYYCYYWAPVASKCATVG